jgi:hypothetical protein
MTTFLAVLGVDRPLSSLMQLLLPLFFITLMTCTLAFSGGVQSSHTGTVILPSLLIYFFQTLHWFTDLLAVVFRIILGLNTTGSCITQPALQQALTF